MFDFDMLMQTPTGDSILANRIAFLVYANDGFKLKHWEHISVYAHNSHRLGLLSHEVVELAYYTGTFAGIEATTGMDCFKLFSVYYKQYVENWNKSKLH